MPFLLDWYTRGSHVLFRSAIQAGATRFLYGGTLRVFDSYPADVYISELHQPLPELEGAVMSRYLGELTCREFARRWALFHICASIPNPRFLLDAAVVQLGYRPEHDFHRHWA